MQQDWYLLSAGAAALISALALWRAYVGTNKRQKSAKPHARIERIRSRSNTSIASEPAKAPARAPSKTMSLLAYDAQGDLVLQVRRILAEDMPRHVLNAGLASNAWQEQLKAAFELEENDALVQIVLKPDTQIESLVLTDQYADTKRLAVRPVCMSGATAKWPADAAANLTQQLQSALRQIFFELSWTDQMRYLQAQNLPLSEQFGRFLAFDNNQKGKILFDLSLGLELLKTPSYRDCVRIILMHEGLISLQNYEKNALAEELWAKIFEKTFEKTQICAYYYRRLNGTVQIGTIR